MVLKVVYKVGAYSGFEALGLGFRVERLRGLGLPVGRFFGLFTDVPDPEP